MPEKYPLSVVILARDEAVNIVRCVEAVSWCDDVVVVDDRSTDETVMLAQSLGARVVSNVFQSFAAQRNWAIEHADLQHDWILMLDADEVCTPELQQEIQHALSLVDDETVAFKMCRKTMFLGKWLKRSDGFPVWIMRMVRKGRAKFADQGHGEIPVPEVDGKMATLKEPFVHYSFSHGISQWVTRHCRYATREAELELQRDQHLKLQNLFSLDRSKRRTALRSLSRRLPARPILRFLYQYICKGGILEGRAGLGFSTLMAFYEALIIIKRWELQLLSKGEQL